MKNDDKTAITSYSDRCLDDGTMLIAHDLEILVLVVEQGIRLADLDGRVRVGFAAQLLEELVDVIVVDVAVAASENAATSPPITETACNPDGSHGTPKPSRSQRNATSAAARVTASAIAPTVSRRPNPMNHINPQQLIEHKHAHGFLLHLPVRGGCSYRMGASTPTCPNASLNRSYARNFSYSSRPGGSSYRYSEPVQHPCRCQSNAVNQRPHEHWDLNGRSGSVTPVSRCRMNVESSLDGTDSRRTCALDVFIIVRPVVLVVSVGLPPSPESRRRTVGFR